MRLLRLTLVVGVVFVAILFAWGEVNFSASSFLGNDSFTSGLSHWTIINPGNETSAPGIVEWSPEYGDSAKVHIEGAPSSATLVQHTIRALNKGERIEVQVAHTYTGNFSGWAFLVDGQTKLSTSHGGSPEAGVDTALWTVDKDYPAGTQIALHTAVWPGTATYWWIHIISVGGSVGDVTFIGTVEAINTFIRATIYSILSEQGYMAGSEIDVSVPVTPYPEGSAQVDPDIQVGDRVEVYGHTTEGVEVSVDCAPYYIKKKEGTNHAPTIVLDFPKGGEILNGTVGIRYHGQDEDHDMLEVTTRLSANGGETWQTIDVSSYETFPDFNEPNLPWDTTAFPNGDNYRMKVIADDGKGGIATDTSGAFSIRNGQNQPPIADFTWDPSNPNVGDRITFTDGSYDPDGYIASWQWDFGDGSTSASQNPHHTYASPGSYQVCLTVTDNAGATDKACKSISIEKQNQPPVADFTWEPSNPKAREQVTFTDKSHDPDGYIASWHWDFGDASTSSQQNPLHSYSTTGDYEVCLTVIDDQGASDTTCKIVSSSGAKLCVEAVGPSGPVEAEVTVTPSGGEALPVTTKWCKAYTPGIEVDLSANPEVNYHDLIFEYWEIGGVKLPAGMRDVHFLVARDTTAVAHYFSWRGDRPMPGDLLFVHYPPKAGWKSMIPGYYDHVGLVTFDNKVIQAQKANGVNDEQTVNEFISSRSKLDEEGWQAEIVLVRVKADYSIKLEALRFAAMQLGKKYDIDWRKKQVFGDSYYCSELVWAAYEAATWQDDAGRGFINLDSSDPATEMDETTPVSPSDIYDSDYVELVKELQGAKEVTDESNTITFIATCPVELSVTDPDGLSIGKDFSEIPGATYTNNDINGDGDPDVRIMIPNRKSGQYLVRVFPAPRAKPSDTYTLRAVEEGGTIRTLAMEVEIKDIPNEPYQFKATSGSNSRTTSIHLSPGWTMVSSPLKGQAALALFGTAVYHWNPATRQYETSTTIDPTNGYWVNIPKDTTVTASGEPVTADVAINISTPGWYQISAPWPYQKSAIMVTNGGVTKSWADAVSAGWVRDQIYGYKATDGAYTTPTTLDPWYGYWMKANVSGLMLTLLYAPGTPVSVSSISTMGAPMAIMPLGLPPLPPTPQAIASQLVFGNSPNPVTEAHTTYFEVKGATAGLVTAIKVEIYDLSGRLVYSSGEVAGTSVDWHTENNDGEYLANGAYLYKIYAKVANQWVASGVKKVVILR